MKNKLLIGLGLLIMVGIISFSFIFIVREGKKDIKGSYSIKELTQDEKTSLIDGINKAYIIKSSVTSEKYDQKILEISDKFTVKINEINEKYDNLEKQIVDAYNGEVAVIDSQIDAIRRQQTSEFFSNGISEKYDELGAQITALQNNKTELWSKNIDNKKNNDSKRREELNPIEASKNREKALVEDDRTLELSDLKNAKNKEIKEVNDNLKHKNNLLLVGIIKIALGAIVILIPFAYVINTFNKLTHLKNKVKESWAQIDVLLKKRTDLIPNILESVKGYSKHEKNTLSDVTKARNNVMKASGKREEIDANNNLSSKLDKIFALAEAYPELKADAAFMDLQNNLKEIEDLLAYTRQDYNRQVLKYKNKLEFFPSNIVAILFKFKPELFFDTDDDKNIEVKF